MTERKWNEIWLEQCEVAEGIRVRYGLASAFDYAVGKKLLNYVQPAMQRPDFARELPRFVSRVRSMFTVEEFEAHLARIERERRESVLTDVEVNEPDFDDSTAMAERARQFTLVKELLTLPRWARPDTSQFAVLQSPSKSFRGISRRRPGYPLPSTIPRDTEMKNTELSSQVATQASLSKSAADAVVNAVFSTISDALVRGEIVTIAGFGVFSTKARPAREGRNPRTGESIAIAPSNALPSRLERPCATR